jgi:hypothetical protein
MGIRVSVSNARRFGGSLTAKLQERLDSGGVLYVG